MGNCFGAKTPKQPHQNPGLNFSAIGVQEDEKLTLRLKIVRDKLRIGEKEMTQKIEKCESQARENLKKNNKSGAKFAIQRKKLYENQIQKNQNYVNFLEQQIIEIESMKDQLAMQKVLKEANQFLENANKQLDLSAFEDLAENNREAQSRRIEIDQWISDLNMEDQREVDEEYFKLEQEIQGGSLNFSSPPLIVPETQQQQNYGNFSPNRHQEKSNQGMMESGIGAKLAALA